MIIADYLKLWLRSLVVSPVFDLTQSLRLASTPLEKLQPSLAALVHTYLLGIPHILQCNPQLPERALQFAGLTLINKILIRLEDHLPFNNTDICSLQIAHQLLCHPVQAGSAILGIPISTLVNAPQRISA